MPEPNFNAPAQVQKNLVAVGIMKANMPVAKMIFLGIFAGCYIAFGAQLCTTVSTGWNGTFFGLMKFFGGAVFSTGLMLVVISGAELFTGNCLMPTALLEKKISFGSMTKNWVVVWMANLAGSLLLAWMVSGMSALNNGAVGATAINIAGAKCGLASSEIFFRAIMCNWLVCLAIVLALASNDIVGKIFGIFFPIMAFVAMGFEHSVANMFFIPSGLIAKTLPKAVELANPALLQALTVGNAARNILLATLGNIVGGSIMVSCIYWFVYVKGTEKK
ncbi:MAG: formate/nitrite transporter family protein [Chitinispirillaceae bacterium]|nr:formate/nitrite transporter family protein [Chitinispirillaceae bacterium]